MHVSVRKSYKYLTLIVHNTENNIIFPTYRFTVDVLPTVL